MNNPNQYTCHLVLIDTSWGDGHVICICSCLLYCHYQIDDVSENEKVI